MREKINQTVVHGEAWVSAFEKVVQYGPFFLGAAGMSGLGAWFASGLTALAGQGWGAFAFAGVGMACVITLVASIGLVAWRYFRPLESKPESKSAAAKAPPIAAPNPQTERDILMLMDFAVYQSTVLMLEDLIENAPQGMYQGPLQLGGDFSQKNADLKEFVDLVRRKLDPGSHRRNTFENVMYAAERGAEDEVENTPMDQRPKEIDPLMLRKWVIAHRQCINAIDFLEREKKNAEEILRNQRSNLLERYRARNPG